MSRLSHYFVLFTIFLASSFTHANRIDTIRSKETLTIGYGPNDFPHTYPNQQSEIQGFDMDLMKAIHAAFAQKLNIPKLKLKLVAIDKNTRFEFIQNGNIDLTCAAHSNTIIRKETFDFSRNYFVAKVRLIVPKNSNIDGYKDLADKKIAAVKGNLAHDLITNKAKQYKIGEIITVASREEILTMLNDGSIDGGIDDDILLLGSSANMGMLDKFKFIGPALSIDNYACILPKDDPEFKAIVDEALDNLYYSNEIDKIYQKWFLEPIDNINGEKVNLNFELSPAIKSLYTTPHDRAIGE